MICDFVSGKSLMQRTKPLLSCRIIYLDLTSLTFSIYLKKSNY